MIGILILVEIVHHRAETCLSKSEKSPVIYIQMYFILKLTIIIILFNNKKKKYLQNHEDALILFR